MSPVNYTPTAARRPSDARTQRARRVENPENAEPENLSDRIVHGHELRAVRGGALDLDFLDHFRNPVHHVVSGQDLHAERHEVGHGAAVTDAFEHLRSDQRDRFRMIQLEAARPPAPGHVRGCKNQQLVDLAFGEPHRASDCKLHMDVDARRSSAWRDGSERRYAGEEGDMRRVAGRFVFE